MTTEDKIILVLSRFNYEHFLSRAKYSADRIVWLDNIMLIIRHPYTDPCGLQHDAAFFVGEDRAFLQLEHPNAIYGMIIQNYNDRMSESKALSLEKFNEALDANI